MEYLIMSMAVVFNIVVLRFKFARKRYLDMFLDAFILILLTVLFGGTLGGMIISTVASAMISCYLYFFPPRIQLKRRYA